MRFKAVWSIGTVNVEYFNRYWKCKGDFFNSHNSSSELEYQLAAYGIVALYNAMTCLLPFCILYKTELNSLARQSHSTKNQPVKVYDWCLYNKTFYCFEVSCMKWHPVLLYCKPQGSNQQISLHTIYLCKKIYVTFSHHISIIFLFYAIMGSNRMQGNVF